MGGLECAGCTLIGFGPAFALFLLVIVRDPLRVILFVAGAFFWLLSLLLSALFWYALVPFREILALSLVFSVVIQELFRMLYWLLLKKAERGLSKLSGVSASVGIEHVHPLQHHVTALVCGLGFGVMSAAFSLVNVLADAAGPGTPGLLDAGDGDAANYLFFLTSSVSAGGMALLHVLWTVLLWAALRCARWQRRALLGLPVLASHLLVSCVSLANSARLYPLSISMLLLVLALSALAAFRTVGGTALSLRVALASCQWRHRAATAAG